MSCRWSAAETTGACPRSFGCAGTTSTPGSLCPNPSTQHQPLRKETQIETKTSLFDSPADERSLGGLACVAERLDRQRNADRSRQPDGPVRRRQSGEKLRANRGGLDPL